jgi:hypothetical protein
VQATEARGVKNALFWIVMAAAALAAFTVERALWPETGFGWARHLVSPATFLVVLLLGAGILARFSPDERARRRVRKATLQAIAQAEDGELGRTVGRVEVAAPTRAPITGRPCASWRTRSVVEKTKMGAVQHGEEQGCVDFVVRDEWGGKGAW